MRRLAAGDKNIDIINMDTIWTPEFAEAGWMRELTGAEKEDALDDVLDGPSQSVTWKDKMYGMPLNTNVQLLWYRKDLVPTPPETWDEMIEMAKKLPAGEGNILEQGQKYEGYVVWFNNLVASAGGKIVNAEGRPTLNEAAVKAATIIKDVATSGRVGPVAVDRAGGPGAPGLRGRQGRVPAQLAVRLRRRAHATPRPIRGDQEGLREHGLRPLARRQQGRAEQGLDRRRQPRHPEDRPAPGARDAGRAVHDERRSGRRQEAINEGLPPVMNATYDDAEVRKVYPFADLLREQLKDSVVRPPTPSYSDVTLAIQDTLHPPAAHQPAGSRSTRSRTA